MQHRIEVVVFSEKAEKDLVFWKKAGNKVIVKKFRN